MSQDKHILSAGVALFTCLMGIALVVRGTANKLPPVYPITGIFFFVSSLLLLNALIGLVWDSFNSDPRAARLIWTTAGGLCACGIISFYSVGLFLIVSGIDWGIVALTIQRKHKHSHRRDFVLALAVGVVLLVVLSYLQSLGPAYESAPPPTRGWMGGIR